MRRRTRILGLALTAIVVCAADSSAAQQRVADVRDVEATREDLQRIVSYFEDASISQAYSPELRAEARASGAEARTRLQEGDFRVGDRIFLSVERQESLTDTFVVARGLILPIPSIGDVPLRGVLRSELQSHLRDHIARFVREPIVRTQSFIRIAVSGEVGEPGYYVVPPERPLSEVLMSIGGLTADATVSQIRVRRGDHQILAGQRVADALLQGETGVDLGLQTGDEIVIPRKPLFTPGEIVRGLGVISGLSFAINRIFR